MEKVTRGISTTESQIEVVLTPITDLTLAGGSAIISYNLQWKVYNSSDAFEDLLGQNNSTLVLTHLQK
jgi:hypothetical protein